ncbi:MAG: glycoside hydrolase family 3 N-terminal domain-containing protein [Chitinophagaceae bacterium]
MFKSSYILLVILSCNYCIALAQPPVIYKDRSQPITNRVQDLVGRMTPEEKFWQLFMIPGDLDKTDSVQYKNGLFGFQVSTVSHGDAGGQLLKYNSNESAATLAMKTNDIQRYFIEKTRLGIPVIFFDEALHGLVRDGATVFPQAIGLAATWDTILMNKIANAIATETKLRGIRQVLSPVVNIAADVRWGRTEETYGEDPFLSSAMGVAFVKAFEKQNIITTPKHFIANVGDGGRDSYPIHLNERVLEEIYFPPFRNCLHKGGSRSLMTAYNSLDGTAASANNWLLLQKLKKEWGFDGFVISDANAVGGEVVLHNTAKNYAASGQHAISNGLDVIFQTEYKHHKLFIESFLNGSIDSNRINDAVARVLKAKFELGLFDDPYIVIDKDNGKHQALAQQASLESIVLLKNENNCLPLSKNTRSIAVIGGDATEARLGGYSGPGADKINILEGIREKMGKNTKLLFAPGCDRTNEEYRVVPAKQLVFGEKEGLLAEYFDNITLKGKPALARIDATVDFHWTLYAPDPILSADFYAVRWTGKLIAPVTGNFEIGLEASDGARLYINNRLTIDNWKSQTFKRTLARYYFEKGKRYDIRIEFFDPNGNGSIKLIWNEGITNNWQKKIKEAVAIAKQSGVAIITAGITEGEFQDRALLSLPGHQEELINAVAATGKPVIVILVGGSAITMHNWIGNTASILDVWYPGEEGGHAIADVLFGSYNPAGRLPVSFPEHEGQLPLVYNHKPTGRGDDYNNLSGLPLFPFGYGLSYTNFEYDNLKFEKRGISKTDSVTVSFTLKNTGTRDGDEVVQLYIRDLQASVARPVIELKGFQRVHLKVGESKTIRFLITPELLSMLNNKMEWVVEPGEFRIMIGASSADLRLKETLEVKE